MTQITKNGKHDDVAGFQRLCGGIAEHYDRFTSVRSGYEDQRQAKGGSLPKREFEKVVEENRRPTSDFIFVLDAEDDDFAVWFRMKYF